MAFKLEKKQSLPKTLRQYAIKAKQIRQEGHDGPVSFYWLIHKLPSYQTLQYLGIGLKHMIPKTD